MEFYEWFVAQCANNEKSVAEVVNAIGVSSASANGWKNGSIPKATTLYKLEQYFGTKFEPDKQDALDVHRILMNEIAPMTEEEIKDIITYVKFKKEQRGNND